MLTIHIVTEHFPPTKGGLEDWTRDICDIFLKLGALPLIYVCSDLPQHSGSLISGPTCVFISSERKILEEPMLHSNTSFGKIQIERQRLNHLLLKKNILSAINKDKNAKHIILSNFFTGTGFLATTLSEVLEIPHIACVVGTDFSRGYINSAERHIVEFVAKNASFIITKNLSQERYLRRFISSDRISSIPTSIEPCIQNQKWLKVKKNRIRLFSDAGYSSKKGTQILLSAFAELTMSGIPVDLTIYGATMKGEETYWHTLIDKYKLELGHLITFESFMEKNALITKILEYDIYCSATLGEGSSSARASILCMGMPMVTTICGEIEDLQIESSHISLSLPGDSVHFSENLKKMCKNFLNDGFSIDEVFVNKMCRYFSKSKEESCWKNILERVNDYYIE